MPPKSLSLLIGLNCTPISIAADNGICAEVAENPANYLVPHPGDCTKFYSCQSQGVGRGWIANLMDCPPTTGFDTQLRICNFIRSLPRCNGGGGDGGGGFGRQGRRGRGNDELLIRAYEDFSASGASPRAYARQVSFYLETEGEIFS